MEPYCMSGILQTKNTSNGQTQESVCMSLEDTNVLWKEYTAIILQCVKYFQINMAPMGKCHD